MRFLPRFREKHEFNISLNIFERHKAHRLIGLRRIWTYRGDETCYPYLFFMLRFVKLARELTDNLCKGLLIGREWMIGDIKADEFTFPIQHLTLIHIADIRELDILQNAGDLTEERHLS